jgi:hypothetical protein
MQLMKAGWFLAMTLSANTLLHAQEDTLHAKDSVIELKDCYENFFAQAEKIMTPSKISLVQKNGKTTSLASFLKTEAMGRESMHGLADLDADGKKELIIYNYTGGAHCCDQYFIFKELGAGKYQYVAKTTAGNVCINEKNELVYNFYEMFGYFFTCYACSFENTSEEAPLPVAEIRLRYSKGKLIIIPGDKELRSTIQDNLAKLSEQPYKPLYGDTDQDNGLRKEFALNLAVFYYSFGKNLAETKKLFDKYYKFPDARKVWSEFVKSLGWIKRDNDF